MTETSMKAMPDINSVEGFNPSEFTRKLPNDDGTMSLYLDVKYRILWFRCCHPTGKIDSDILHVDEKSELYAANSIMTAMILQTSTLPRPQPSALLLMRSMGIAI